MLCIGLINNLRHLVIKKFFHIMNTLKNKGACFGEVAGFERPMWYAH